MYKSSGICDVWINVAGGGERERVAKPREKENLRILFLSKKEFL